MLSRINRPAGRPARPLLPPIDGSPESLEVYRQVCVSLSLPSDVQPIVIGVTSAVSGEGRTTVALGLAQTLAIDMDAPVTLVEADLERPSLGHYFSIPPTPGLAEVLSGEYRIDEVRNAVAPNLSVVTTGAAGVNSARLFREIAVTDPLHDVERLEGIIIVDLPPIINHSYSILAASVTDAIIIVVRAGVTPIDMVREAIGRLDQNVPQGVVLNGPRLALPSWFPGSDNRAR